MRCRLAGRARYWCVFVAFLQLVRKDGMQPATESDDSRVIPFSRRGNEVVATEADGHGQNFHQFAGGDFFIGQQLAHQRDALSHAGCFEGQMPVP